MLTFKKHRKYFSFFLLMLCSLFTMFGFQNCGQPIHSQSSSSTAGTNTTASTPNPAVPPPGPTTGAGGGTVGGAGGGTVGGTVGGAEPLTAADRRLECAKYIDPSKAASLTVSATDLSMLSGLGTGSGDSVTATVNQSIASGLTANVSNLSVKGKTPTSFACSVSTVVSCVVVNDSAHPTKITQAFNMNGASALYGVNEGADTGKTMAIADAVFAKGNTCGTTLAPQNATANSRDFTLNNQRNQSGYRCVKGEVWIRMSVITTVEGTIVTKTPTDTEAKYIKVTLNDGCWKETRLKSVSQVPVRLANMGAQLAATDTWIAAVAPLDNIDEVVQTGVGGVYMFRNVNGVWSFHSRVVLPGAAKDENISAAAISGTKLVVSSHKRNFGSGVAFVYNFNGTSWVVETSAVSSPSVPGQNFGVSMAMSGSHLVVGAPGFSGLSGAVYVYDCSAANCLSRYIINNTRKAGAAFGSSLAMSGNRVAIGAPQALQALDQGEGFVEVWDIEGTAQPAGYKTAPSVNAPINDEPSGMRFGASVAIRGSTLLVGAPNYNTNGTDRTATGGAYFYSNYATTDAASFLNTGPDPKGYNGRGVALNSSGAYVGCPGCNGGEGIVRFYAVSAAPQNVITTTPGYLVFALNRASNSGFGSALSVTDLNLAAGSPYKEDPNVQGGASYVYKLP